MKPRVKPSANDLLARLRAAQAGEPETVPAGWLPAGGWAKRWNLSDSHARRLVALGVANGLLAMRKFRTRHANRVMVTPHYSETP